MIVLVCRNINSGKSTAIEKLKPLFPDYVVVSIDDVRKRFGDGSLSGEYRACEMFVTEVTANENALVELTGLGYVGMSLLERLAPKSFIVIHMHEELDVCIERISGKDFSAIPYPENDGKIEDTIRRLDMYFKSGLFKELWSEKALQIIEIRSESELLSIRLT